MMKAARSAVLAQRDLAVREEEIARKTLEGAGCEIVTLTPAERAAFARAVKPAHEEARKRYGDEIFNLVLSR